jgi:hypothetical protein
LFYSGTVRRVNYRAAALTLSRSRLYTTQVAPAKKFSKWKMLKNGTKFGVVAALGYGGYGKKKTTE